MQRWGSLIRAIVITPALLVTMSSRPGEACSRESETGLGIAVLPATGSSAPPNTWIWVPAPTRYSYDVQTGTSVLETIEASDVVIKLGLVTIPTSARTVIVRGEVDSSLLIFDPIDLLPAGATIDVIVEGKPASQFVVTAAEDRSPPSPPVATSVAASGAYFGYWFCGAPTRVSVTIDSIQELLILTTEAAEPARIPDDILAITTGDQVDAVALPPGAHNLRVVAADLAGNVSSATALPVVAIPAKVTGCNAGSEQGAALLVIAIAVPMLGRRRRHGLRHPCSGLGSSV